MADKIEYPDMKEVPIAVYAVQNDKTNAILIKVGDDPPFELASWSRSHARMLAAAAERTRKAREAKEPDPAG